MLILIAIGTLEVLSSTAPPGYKGGEGLFLFRKHILSILLGFGVLLVLRKVDYEVFFRLSKPIFFGSLVLLLMVFLKGIGVRGGGASRWIRIAPGFAFQPAELLKLSMIIYTASFLCRKRNLLDDFGRGFLPLALLTFGTAALLLAQPDMGTAVVIIGVGVMLWWVGGMKTMRIVKVLLLLIALGALFIWIEPYRRERILAFLNPWAAPHGFGYQIIQALLAFGVGGFWGVGLGRGLQKFYYLPAPHTDFIFAVIGEELGFLGSIAVLVLYMALGWASFSISKRAPTCFGKLLGMGITFLILLQALINLGGVTNFIPSTGIPLPFVSYGGTSMVVSLSCVGILLNIASKVGGEEGSEF
ncbi:MAG: putative lipid II flippase FtsW [Synergistetes bacterium]|nr:putative lipid II flippase FtsW [Synergistota bacterium]